MKKQNQLSRQKSAKELKLLLDQKTAELELKNRELEIEAALDRVRSRSMSMQKTDELLEAGGLLYQELSKLGIGSLTSAYGLMDEKEKIVWYYYASPEDGSTMSEPMGTPCTETQTMRSITTSWKKQEPYHVIELDPQETIDHQTYIAECSTDFPYNAAELISFSPERLVLQTFNFKQGYLLNVGGVKFAEDEVELMIRFTKAFEQTYTRFLDLQKAEAQAREAQIEAALERVRARSMAMQASEELGVVVFDFFEQLHPFGFSKWGCALALVDKEKQGFNIWFSTPSNRITAENYFLPNVGNPIVEKFWSGYKEQLPLFNIELRDEQKYGYTKWLFDNTDLGRMPDSDQEAILLEPYVMFSLASMKVGILEAIDHTPIPKEQAQILPRFAKVFEQTYTRFLDLQKAEAQAREAQIEAALERVRARSMAMHNAEELADVSSVVYDEFQKLGITEFEACGFHIVDEEKEIHHVWNFHIDLKQLTRFEVPLTGDPVLNDRYKSWKRKEPVFYQKIGGKKRKDHLEFLWPMETSTLEENTAKQDIPDPVHFYFGNFSNGYLHILTSEVLTQEQASILGRFSKVFEQTYIRFLDLQKAEAQAREAQIEAALERVRSRTMAMHKSDELSEVVSELYQQMEPLGLSSGGCELILCNEKTGQLEYWQANPVQKVLPEYKVSRSVHPLFEKQWNAWKKSESRLIIKQEGKEKKEFEALLFEQTEFKNMPEETKNYIQDSGDVVVFSHVTMKYGLLEAVDIEPLSEDILRILQRFASVFEQTYTRFLDLQKSEAQAREAQIEAALERVRTRAMGMHKSEELGDAATLLYKELIALGFSQFFNCGYVLIDKKNKIQNAWLTDPGGKFLDSFILPLTGDKVLQDRYDGWKRKDPVFYQVVEGDVLKKHLEFVTPDFDSREMENVATQMPDPTIFYCGNFFHGYLHIVAADLLTVEQEALLARFTRVFEMTYRRFLDLQKAEAQAREAQIEAALERVRSRSMAMRDSNELAEILGKIFEELTLLDVELARCIIWIIDPETETARMWFASSEVSGGSKSYFLPNFNHPFYRKYIAAWKARKSLWKLEITGKLKESWDQFLFEETELKELPDEAIEAMRSPDKIFTTNTFNQYGLLATAGIDLLSEESINIFQRFGRVFEQFYTRFEDIKQAEVQAREAQIETALERVRAKALAMHVSGDLEKVAIELRQQMSLLDQPELVGCVVELYEVDSNYIESWHGFHPAGDQDAELLTGIERFPKDSCQVIKEMLFMYQSSENEYTLEAEGRKLKEWYAVLKGNLPEVEKVTIPEKEYYHCTDFTGGTLLTASLTPPSMEVKDLQRRAASVFDLAYRRFLDLKKAEKQAREAEIELALERVRARTMAMQKSEELREVIASVFTQLQELDFDAPACSLIIYDKNQAAEHWFAGFSKEIYPESYKIPYVDHPYFTDPLNAWKKQVPYQEFIFEGELKKSYGEYAFENSEFKNLPDEAKDALNSMDKWYISDAFMKHGMLEVLGDKSLAEDKSIILQRFAKVFEQTYTRFLDLQKAEAQAREAQIEAALERVRSRSMAMHKSEELPEVALVLWEQLEKLKLKGLDGCAIHVNDDETDTFEAWSAFPDLINGERKMKLDNHKHDQHCIWVYEEWDRYYRTGEIGFTAECNKEQLNEFIDWFAPMLPLLAEEMRSLNLDKLYVNGIAFSNGILGAPSIEPLSDETWSAFKRLAVVFDMAYRRFEDLQKSEAQAREAQIEAALERVRSRSMAMQHSSEINIILAKVFEELTLLELELERCVIWTYNQEDKSVRWWAANAEAKSGAESFLITNQDHPVYLEYWKAWEERKTKYLYILEGENMVSWCDVLFNETELGRLPEEVQVGMRKPDRVYLNNTFNDFGVLFIACQEPLSDEKFSIIERFGKVFDQSYTRFNDIKQAEALAREAIKQASLDRVRGEIASMRSKDDLSRITPLVWHELTTLTVPFIRCGILIMDEKRKVIQSYLSAPDGHSLGVFDLPYESKEIARGALAKWKKGKIYKDHWNKGQFLKFYQNLVDMGQIENPESYQGTAKPPESLNLHFLPFKQGMLYVGNVAPLSQDELQLVQSLAEAFSIAYARYEDFKQLEEAKNETEQTLDELKSTQSQLIQSEKMASLGELTAGIAHEIQNPLNFVNNFAEVSGELIDELKEERAKLKEERDGSLEEEILDDITQNLSKINHHGQQASGIVKGMLEHSRTSTGKKELTDINVLADEYLRLAYHGLRAKDKSFNADFKLELDKSLPKLNVVSQEIGRVLLNLINNAFYAVSKASHPTPKATDGKEATEDKDYQPQVIVSTKRNDKTIEITVQDNGDGIPEDVVDKIFQPFFTTKPTGQGTGLGLSLSYDIITKGHDGHLEVETEEGMGTRFVVRLPLT